MYVDLNLPVKLNMKAESISIRAKKAYEHGFTACAINNEISGIISPSFSKSYGFTDLMVIYQRVTIITDKINHLIENLKMISTNSFSFDGLVGYDIIAVKPLNNYVFDISCTLPSITLIALDFTKKTIINIKPSNLRNASRRGIKFEICLAQMFGVHKTKKVFLVNIITMVRVTNGNGIVLTSGSISATDIRSPHEVINMGIALGMSSFKAKLAISHTPYECITCHLLLREKLQRKTLTLATCHSIVTLGMLV